MSTKFIFHDTVKIFGDTLVCRDIQFGKHCNNATIEITNVLTKLLGEALEMTVKIFVRAFENANQEKVFQEISSYL
jgi:hypothetical protein